jgi:transglutaminase-like putative cysteine protease
MNAYSLHAEPLLSGDDGTSQTVARIRELVHQGKNDPRINHFVGRLLRAARVRSFDRPGERRAIFSWVLRNIRFQQDPVDAECLRPAVTTLEWGFGDCDDINAILLPSLLGAAGHHTRIVTISSHPGAPEQFSHVYCEALGDRGQWIPLDAAREGTRYGSAPARFYRKRTWSLESDDYQDLRGAGCSCGQGVLAMRRRGMLGRSPRSLGQFDWSSLANAIGASGNAAASIVRAAQTPVVFPSQAEYPQIGVAPSIAPGGGVSAVGSVSSTTLVLIGAAIVGVVLLTRRP